MRVTFNTSTRTMAEALQRASAEMVRRQREVATGRRVNVASDDPSAAASAVGEHAELAATEIYRKASDTVTSRLTVIDTILTGLIDETTAAKVAAHSGRGSMSPTQREAAANNILAIRESLLSAVNTQYRGAYLFSGSDSTTQPFAKTGTSVSGYQGESATIQVDIDRQTAVSVVLDGGTLLSDGSGRDIFAALEDLAEAVRNGDDAGITAGLATVDEVFNRLNAAQGRVGSDMALVQAHGSQLDARTLASETRLSTLENADLAESISAMTQADTAYRAALSAVGKTSGLSLLDYLR